MDDEKLRADTQRNLRRWSQAEIALLLRMERNHAVCRLEFHRPGQAGEDTAFRRAQLDHDGLEIAEHRGWRSRPARLASGDP